MPKPTGYMVILTACAVSQFPLLYPENKTNQKTRITRRLIPMLIFYGGPWEARQPKNSSVWFLGWIRRKTFQPKTKSFTCISLSQHPSCLALITQSKHLSETLNSKLYPGHTIGMSQNMIRNKIYSLDSCIPVIGMKAFGKTLALKSYKLSGSATQKCTGMKSGCQLFFQKFQRRINSCGILQTQKN